ncbi:MAG: ATP-dependent Clp protease ATP-binding subunit [Lachnospiraceae bacterium]|nr:ATP-dependent Clp protease ATP-binding subunit [Lachnospiraceae bacterium]
MLKKYTDKAKSALAAAGRYARTTGQGYVGCEHILLGLALETGGTAAAVLADNGVDAEKVKELIREQIALNSGDTVLADREKYSPRAMTVLQLADEIADRFESERIGTEHLLLGIIREGQNVALRLMNTMGINIQKVYVDLLTAMGEDVSQYKEDLYSQQNESRTDTIERYSQDLTRLAREGKLDPVIGRDEEINRTIQILSRRTKNNPCLIGEPGVGKTAVVEGLAQRIASGQVPYSVRGRRLLPLDLSGMVAGSKYRGEFEERIKNVIREVIADGDIILFLDELHTIIGAGGAEGAIDASNILKPSLARGELQLIGATTITEYRKYIEKDAALERRFQPVTVEEPSEEETEKILQGIVYKYEEHHQVKVLPEAITAAVKLSSRYINDRNLPDKAIDLIDEAASAVRLASGKAPTAAAESRDVVEQVRKRDLELEEAIKAGDMAKAGEVRARQEKVIHRLHRFRDKSANAPESRATVGEEDVARVVSMWTKIPLTRLQEKESDRLLKLESILHQRVIGQDEAVDAVARAVRRGRVGLKDPKRPIGSFLFLGPTGVGKTELSKALAEAMFGDENALIRVDMSEYMEGHSVSKMIGSPPGYVGFDEGGQLSEKIRRNPYSVVLFDEIEKAHPDVFNILLQVLDDGHITDSKGRKVSFKNTILIMTSNAGAARIVEPKNLGFAAADDQKKDFERMKSGVMEEVKRLFKPEFINRIDEMIVFHPLTQEEMKEIVNLLAKDLSKRCKEQMGIRLVLSPALKEHLVTKYSDAKMGARPLKRALQTVVEDPLAEELLRQKIPAGSTITAGFSGGKVTFRVKREQEQNGE